MNNINMETINSKFGIYNLTKLRNRSFLNNNSIKDISSYYRSLSTITKSVRLTLLPNQKNLLNNTLSKSLQSNSEIHISSKKSYSSINISLPIKSINIKIHSENSINDNQIIKSKNNCIQLSNYSSLVDNIVRKNALNQISSNEKKINQTNFHTVPVLKDQDDDMPKFRDSREKKEYIKLATKRNDIAARGRMEGSYHWALSKIVIAGILSCVVASGIVGHHMFIDVLLGVLLPMHVYYTFQDLVFDYIPSRRYPRLNKFLIWIIRITTLISLFSMFKFNTEDIGISDAAKQAWNAAKTQKPDEEIKDEDIYYDSK